MNKKVPFGFFDEIVVRIPVLTESYLADCNDEGKIIASLAALREGLLLSSPDLYDTMLRYDSLPDDRKKKALISLYKYLIRACTRPTPYGLFSGTFTGKWGDGQSGIIVNQDFKVNFSLDFRILGRLKLILDEYASDAVSYFVNNTAEQKPDKIKILKFGENDRGMREYYMAEFALGEPLRIVMDFLKNGKTKKKDIIDHLVLQGADRSEAEQYVDELIDANILISEFEIFLNNNNYFDFVCEQIQLFSLPEEKKALMLSIKQEISSINNGGDLTIERIARTADLLETLLENDIKSKVYFKSDLISLKNPVPAAVSNVYQQQLLIALDLFNRFGLTRENNLLSDFVTQFTDRYQYQAVPILQLLDPNYGVIYGEDLSLNKTPLIDDMPFIKYSQAPDYYATSSFFFSKLNDAVESGDREIVIKDNELEGFQGNLSDFSDTVHILFRIVDAQKKIVQVDTAGSGALNIASRFGYGCGKLQNLLKEVVRYEDYAAAKKGRVRSEVMHIPDRIEACNIIDNTALRSYQIPIAYYDNNQVNTILPEDILVTVRNKKIVLFSKGLQKEIIPCISSMLLPASVSQLPLFRFLADLSLAHKKNYSFSWTNVSGTPHVKYFPRLRYKNIILSPALWRITREDIKGIIDADLTQESISQFLNKFKIPAKVIVKDYDNELLIDFSQPYAVQVFVSEVIKSQGVMLAEYLYGDSSLLSSPYNQNINSQLIAFLHKDEALLESEAAGQIPLKIYSEEDLIVTRSFPPGSEWVYYKIYCSENDADDFLSDKLGFLVAQLLDERLISSWFFIRYIDESFHIRLRFLLTDNSRAYLVMSAINTFIAEQLGTVKISIDTYEREIERYGKETMLLSEAIFYHDSQFALGFLDACRGDSYLRWNLAIHAIDDLLDVFKFDIDDKIAILFELKDEFSSEFNFNAPMNQVIKEKFRKYKNDKLDLLSKYDLTDFNEILAVRRLHLLPVAAAIKQLSPELFQLVKSLIHMSNNRYFLTEHRKHEAVLYNIMYKDYISQKAIKSIKKTGANL